MKQCTKCNQIKELSKFRKKHNACKSCALEYNKIYNVTKEGVIARIYGDQKNHSKTRGHTIPTYTKQELFDWLINDWLFDLLYNNWLNCGHINSMKPSIDRLDDSKGYSFDNILLNMSLVMMPLEKQG